MRTPRSRSRTWRTRATALTASLALTMTVAPAASAAADDACPADNASDSDSTAPDDGHISSCQLIGLVEIDALAALQGIDPTDLTGTRLAPTSWRVSETEWMHGPTGDIPFAVTEDSEVGADPIAPADIDWLADNAPPGATIHDLSGLPFGTAGWITDYGDGTVDATVRNPGRTFRTRSTTRTLHLRWDVGGRPAGPPTPAEIDQFAGIASDLAAAHVAAFVAPPDEWVAYPDNASDPLATGPDDDYLHAAALDDVILRDEVAGLAGTPTTPVWFRRQDPMPGMHSSRTWTVQGDPTVNLNLQLAEDEPTDLHAPGNAVLLDVLPPAATGGAAWSWDPTAYEAVVTAPARSYRFHANVTGTQGVSLSQFADLVEVLADRILGHLPGPLPPAPPTPPAVPSPAPTPAPPVELTNACPDDLVDDPEPFRDVRADSAHGKAVACIARWGITVGQTATSYAPTGEVTRGQAASYLARLLEAAGIKLHPGVPGGPGVHGRAAHQLAVLDIMRGGREGWLNLGRPVTRGQLATMVDRTLSRIGAEPATATAAEQWDLADHAHGGAIRRLAAAGIVLGGDGGGGYDPDAPLRRDHAASVLMRTLDTLVASADIDPADILLDKEAAS